MLMKPEERAFSNASNLFLRTFLLKYLSEASFSLPRILDFPKVFEYFPALFILKSIYNIIISAIAIKKIIIKNMEIEKTLAVTENQALALLTSPS